MFYSITFFTTLLEVTITIIISFIYEETKRPSNFSKFTQLIQSRDGVWKSASLILEPVLCPQVILCQLPTVIYDLGNCHCNKCHLFHVSFLLKTLLTMRRILESNAQMIEQFLISLNLFFLTWNKKFLAWNELTKIIWSHYHIFILSKSG